MKPRHVLFVTGTRADFGLMENALRRAAADERIRLSICVTGTHLMPEFGMTVNEVEATGIPISARIAVDLADADGAVMAIALADQLRGMTQAMARERPDIVLLLGDRGEMLAGALAALHLNIPVAHVHGGELSGTVDEPIRHAISKLAHYHFAATQEARERLVRMGEWPEHIVVTGAPGLDGLQEAAVIPRRSLFDQAGLDPDRPTALVVFHPVVQSAELAGAETQLLARTLLDQDLQLLWMLPNSDAGSSAIRAELETWANDRRICLATHLSRETYASWMRHADIMVGNSSSGIIEAATLGLPVVNVGLRQLNRERSGNVVDSEVEPNALAAAISKAMAMRGRVFENVYGQGDAGIRITELLATLPLTRELLHKQNAY